ncbi:hypothetical protein [Nostoc sp. UHCC 0252]|nr:hypothetical protein [Nostoc sp. UHCC 0252]MEA5599722.1 hypothetical protein [Nostoc sp. UHCC 0252]
MANIDKLIRALWQELMYQENFAAEFGVNFLTINGWENGDVRLYPLRIQ